LFNPKETLPSAPVVPVSVRVWPSPVTVTATDALAMGDPL
jgi:hypothetical protein